MYDSVASGAHDYDWRVSFKLCCVRYFLSVLGTEISTVLGTVVSIILASTVLAYLEHHELHIEKVGRERHLAPSRVLWDTVRAFPCPKEHCTLTT
jgi:hypothetical protein